MRRWSATPATERYSPPPPRVTGSGSRRRYADSAPIGTTGNDKAVFTYQVTNTGREASANVQVTDDRLTDVKFVAATPTVTGCLMSVRSGPIPPR